MLVKAMKGVRATATTRYRRGFAGALMLIALVVAGRLALPVPGSPVPVSLQSLALVLGAALVGSRAGVVVVLVYLVLGAAGIPVFASGGAGVPRLFGPTGGFLLGFLPAAAIAGLAARNSRRATVRSFAGCGGLFLAAHAVILTCGALWLAASLGWERAWSGGVEPFLAGAALKSLVAAILVVCWPTQPAPETGTDRA